MGLLLLIAVTFAAAAIVYGSVRFLEPDRASKGKALVVVVLFAVWNGVRTHTGLHIPVILDWLVYFAVTALLIWLVFRLKPLHCVTVGAFYVVARYALFASMGNLPDGFWKFFGGGA